MIRRPTQKSKEQHSKQKQNTCPCGKPIIHQLINRGTWAHHDTALHRHRKRTITGGAASHLHSVRAFLGPGPSSGAESSASPSCPSSSSRSRLLL